MRQSVMTSARPCGGRRGTRIRDGICQPACKPGSVWRVAPPRRPFLWGADRSVPRATNPGGGEDRAGARVAPRTRAAPIRSCSRWGLPCRLRCRTRGALLPHRFTLAFAGCPARAVSSLWHFPWGRPRRPLAATVDPWSPDFPPPRPMAAKPARATAAVRPAGKRNKGGKSRQVKGRAASRTIGWLDPLGIRAREEASQRICRSHLGFFEDEHLDAAGRELADIGRRGLALRAGKGSLDRRHIVEVQGRDEMNC